MHMTTSSLSKIPFADRHFARLCYIVLSHTHQIEPPYKIWPLQLIVNRPSSLHLVNNDRRHFRKSSILIVLRLSSLETPANDPKICNHRFVKEKTLQTKVIVPVAYSIVGSGIASWTEWIGPTVESKQIRLSYRKILFPRISSLSSEYCQKNVVLIISDPWKLWSVTHNKRSKRRTTQKDLMGWGNRGH